MAVRSTPRRRPVWNGYLTDDTRYRLSEQQQLQRQLQHLSTAHFAARSPSHALHAARLTPTPSRNSASREYAVHDASQVSVPSKNSHSSTLHSARPHSADSVTRRRKVGATVSFQLDDHDDHDDRAHNVDLQSELAALEHMLLELEAETATLHEAETVEAPASASAGTYSPVSLDERPLYTLREPEADSDETDATRLIRAKNEHDCSRAASIDNASVGGDVYDGDSDGNDGGVDSRLQPRSAQRSQRDRAKSQQSQRSVAEPIDDDSDDNMKLSQACYKSLRISVRLSAKLEHLARALESERQLRLDHELKIEVLEQEVQSTRARCNYLDAKYQSVVAQVDDMRDALLAADGAMRRTSKQHKHMHQQQQLGAERQRTRSAGNATPRTASRSRNRLAVRDSSAHALPLYVDSDNDSHYQHQPHSHYDDPQQQSLPAVLSKASSSRLYKTATSRRPPLRSADNHDHMHEHEHENESSLANGSRSPTY